MKLRYSLFAAGAAFLIVSVVAFFHARNGLAAAVNAVTGVIFIALGISPPRRN